MLMAHIEKLPKLMTGGKARGKIKIKKQLGIASESTYWSTARSGGAHGLGIVPEPAEINHSLTGGLGVVPNDFQIAFHRPYLPVMHGWIYDGKQTYRDGNLGSPIAHTMGLGAPIVHTMGLGGSGVASALGISDEDVARIVKAEQLKAKMSIVSAIAFSIVAAAAIYGALKK